METNKYETQAATDFGNVTAENILDKGTETYGKAERAVGEAYDKTSQKIKQTYEKARNYSTENPGRTVLMAVGIGVGIGLLLSGSTSHRSRTSRIAEPVVNALSEIAHRFYH